MLYSINWDLLLKILDNVYIANVCFPDCDVINIKINLIFTSSLPDVFCEKGAFRKENTCDRVPFLIKFQA